jgi:uncharacterized protein (AIM24 family)
MTGLFGGEGFIMQKLEGTGMVFMHAGGTIVERVLQPGEVLHIDTGCVVACWYSSSLLVITLRQHCWAAQVIRW